VTFSPLPDNSKDEPQAVVMWDVRTGYRKRSFHCENASAWPIFKSVFMLISAYCFGHLILKSSHGQLSG